jgi:hypothetical protein
MLEKLPLTTNILASFSLLILGKSSSLKHVFSSLLDAVSLRGGALKPRIIVRVVESKGGSLYINLNTT